MRYLLAIALCLGACTDSDRGDTASETRSESSPAPTETPIDASPDPAPTPSPNPSPEGTPEPVSPSPVATPSPTPDPTPDPGDQDGDGFRVGIDVPYEETDCNDNDPLMYPGAVEICGENIDQNCNHLIEMEPKDEDLDGWVSCLWWYDGTLTDCFDGSRLYAPDAYEYVGDGIDENCNGRDDY